MSLASWLEEVRRRVTQATRSGRLRHRPERRRQQCRPWLEVLEERLPPTVTLSLSNPIPFPKPDSGQLLGVFVVTRSGDLAPAVQVDYATQDGIGTNGAHAGTDYLATSGTLSFASNQTTATIPVPILGNNIFQADKTFTVSLTNPWSSGVDFFPPQSFVTGHNPVFAAAADLNGDGKPDLAVANAEITSASVLLNRTPIGATTLSFAPREDFTNGAGNAPSSVLVADLNGDGKPDLILINSGASISVLLGDGNGGFGTPQVFTTGVGSSAVVADFNGDSKPDIAFTNPGGAHIVSVLVNTTPMGATTVSFAPPQFFDTVDNPSFVEVGDFNGDGKPDLAVASIPTNSVSVLLNTTPIGATTLSFAPQQTFPTPAFLSAMAVADINGDGKPDLVFANGNGDYTVTVLLNTTQTGATIPSFAAQQTFAGLGHSTSVAVADLNGDGKPDLAFANDDNTVSVLPNTTPMGAITVSFAPPQSFATGSNTRSVVAADLNGDGKPDLVFVNSVFDGVVQVLVNRGLSITLSGSPATGTISSALEAPASISIAAGNNQTAAVNTAFATNLAVDIRDAGGTLIQNANVTFTAPGTGASGLFDGSASVTVVTNASGRATAPIFVANAVAGTYAVGATASGGSDPSTSFTLTNAVATADHFLLTAPPGVTVGTSVSLTVTVQDVFGNTVPGYTGTVHFTSSDRHALLPANYTFQAADQGRQSFSIIFQNAGMQIVTVTDAADPTITGRLSLNVGAGIPIQRDQTAGIGFWHNNHGQALIRSFNGAPSATSLANWLAANFPNLFGGTAGSHNLTGQSNSQVAEFYQRLFNEHAPKLDAEVLATALNVYATTRSLGGTAAQRYGFVVTNSGLGASVFNVGDSGIAFGVPNGTRLSVLEILRRANARAVGGVLYNGDRVLRDLAIDVFEDINEAGAID